MARTQRLGDDSGHRRRRPSLDRLRDDLLRLSTEEAHESGWTGDAIAEAASALVRGERERGGGHCSMAVVGLFQPIDVVRYVMARWNRRLDEELSEESAFRSASTDVASASSRLFDHRLVDRVALALERRLLHLEPYVLSKRWHEAMALGAQPDKALVTAQQLQWLVRISVRHAAAASEIGAVAGPLPAEAAQLSLGGAAYVAAELHMLTDASERYADTRRFLRERVAD